MDKNVWLKCQALYHSARHVPYCEKAEQLSISLTSYSSVPISKTMCRYQRQESAPDELINLSGTKAKANRIMSGGRLIARVQQCVSDLTRPTIM